MLIMIIKNPKNLAQLNLPFKKIAYTINPIFKIDVLCPINKRNATYFRTIQPLNYHSKVPLKHIYIYSFSLKPEEHQPSGVCNFSKLKKVELKFENPNTSNTEILIFGVAYNLLRFKGGLAGLAYGS